MSTTSSPIHRNNFEPNAFYDPDFTVEISNRMRVPDKISLLPGTAVDSDQSDRLTSNVKGKGSNDWMRVPDRIIVQGNNRFEEGREVLPEHKLESSILGEDPIKGPVQLMTPPRNLRLNEHLYPSVEPDDSSAKIPNQLSSSQKELSFYGGDLGGTPENHNNSRFYQQGGNDESNLMRKQVRSLSRRVSALERDNQQRYHREVVFYSLGVIYFILKGLSWFNRSW